MNGILVIDKPESFTSRDVVNVFSKTLSTRKVGHTGTLDPMATGVLVLCIGAYTKLVDKITAFEKEYIATIDFGIETDTLDITGTVLKKNSDVPTKENLIKVLSNMIGTQLQEVPIYSAKRVNGKKLYYYARAHENVELPKQEIEILELELLDFSKTQAVIRARVSKGTYIRSLIRDICQNLQVIGSMSALKRTKQGTFSIDHAYSLEDVRNQNFKLLTVKDLFTYETIELNESQYHFVSHANTIQIDSSLQYLLFTYQGTEIAFYQKRIEDYKPLFLF